MVAEGWTLFKQTCEEVGPGELPQLLRQLKGSTTPSPTLVPTPQVIPKAEPMEEQPSPVPRASTVVPVVGPSRFIETTIIIKLGPHQYTYKYGNCNISPRTRCAMDAHICSMHTKKSLLHSFCHLSTYNMDSLQRHEKENK